MMPQAITAKDREGRSCVYVPAGNAPPAERPQDQYGDGSDLRFRILEYGGEYADDMPASIRVIDSEGRSCVYSPITVEGRVVDSKGFKLECVAR
jgi:hypothetical protein